MAITSFHGANRFLSNFYYAPIEFEGAVYPTLEHAFQAAKTTDPTQRLPFQQATHPAEARRLGRRIALRKDWEAVKIQIMEQLLRQKFTAYPALGKALVMTAGQELIEGNAHGDTFWGICRGQGQNWLGRLLMKIREEIACGRCGGKGSYDFRPGDPIECAVCQGKGLEVTQWDYAPGSTQGRRIA